MVKKVSYIPDRGDIVIMNFDPQSGHEQKGRRPALVISSSIFNNFTKGFIVCPITNTKKNNPLRVQLSAKSKTTGYIMCDQIKTVDYIARNASFKGKIDKPTFNEVIDIIKTFFD